MNTRQYVIVIGSSHYFRTIQEYYSADKYNDFLELIRQNDLYHNNKNTEAPTPVGEMIVKNNHYHGITETAHDRLGPLIESLTNTNGIILIHNPPRTLLEFIHSKSKKENITEHREDYLLDYKIPSIDESITKLNNKIIGQEDAIKEIIKSLIYQTKSNRKKPYVIMLYGESSLGKTETVRAISEIFFQNNIVEKHLSMFKNNVYSDYIFGDKPNRKSLGYDLLERKSNLLFLDELDKCPEYFYSSFYTLFDNTIFKDSTYDVDISGLIIFLTSNFLSLDEMKAKLGNPIYYRIDKFIQFTEFSPDEILQILKNEVDVAISILDSKYTFTTVLNRVANTVYSKNENARTIKQKVQDIIEEILFEENK